MFGLGSATDQAERRRRRAAKKVARWLNAREFPDIDPLSWRVRLLFWAFVVAVIAFVVFGSAVLPQPR